LAFVSLIIVFIAIFLLILGILFIAGLIFLNIGIKKRKKFKNKGKKHPIILIIIGTLLLLPTAIFIVIVLATTLITNTKTTTKQTQYECIPDKWRNEHVQDRSAAQEVLDALLESADNGDKEAFAMNFTPEIQEQSDFDHTLDMFFKSYPQGLSECEIEVRSAAGPGSYNYGHTVRTAGTSIDVVMDGDWYRIGLSFCHENTDNPEKVGVTDFNISNLKGAAYNHNEYDKNPDYLKDEYLTCSIINDSEISARLIEGIPFLWTDTPEPKLTENEMRKLLTAYRNEGLGCPEIHNVIGEPNVSTSGYDYYYELAPKEDGTPQYVYISTNRANGSIINAYLCDSENMHCNNPIVEFIKVK